MIQSDQEKANNFLVALQSLCKSFGVKIIPTIQIVSDEPVTPVTPVSPTEPTPLAEMEAPGVKSETPTS